MTRILYVEDNEVLQRILKRVLESTGEYEVVSVSDPRQAILRALEVRPELFLLDENMPGMTGIELAEEIKAHPEFRQCRIAFYSANPVAGYPAIQKPSSIPALNAFIQEVLSTPANKKVETTWFHRA